MGFNWLSFVCRICVFELTWGQQRLRINGTGAARICSTANVYQGIMEFTNSEYTNKFYSLFHRWLLSLLFFMQQLVPLLIIKPTHNNFSTHYYAFSA
jgi:hypothetical protein